jgi:hypothetical protein
MNIIHHGCKRINTSMNDKFNEIKCLIFLINDKNLNIYFYVLCWGNYKMSSMIFSSIKSTNEIN